MPKHDQPRSQLLNNVSSAIRRGHLLLPGDNVGVCVSGGADSVALLHVMIELEKRLGIVLSVVHFNHQLRGKQSDADEKFVAGLAAKHDLPFHVARENVAAKAKREKANVEDAGRRARYAFFARLVDEGKLTRLAVAHTADDQAETVLAHILRGTGLAGLGGIHPTFGNVVRPLLQIRRAALRVYLRERKQTWREDATNRDISKMRARIRKKLLPLLERQFQPAIVEHLAALADLAREDQAHLDFITEVRAATAFERTGEMASIKTADLLGGPESSSVEPPSTDFQRKNRSMSRRLVRHIVEELKPGSGQLNANHVQSIIMLAENGENGKCLPLPGGMEVRREHDRLVFRPKRNTKPADDLTDRPKKFEQYIDFSGSEVLVEVPCLACAFRFRMIDWPAKRGETMGTGLVLDRHALRLPLVLRSWRPGDQFRPSGHRKAHKLKRLLNEKRVSRWEREGWPVLTSGETLVWVRGFPVAAEFAVNEDTRVGIQIAEEKLAQLRNQSSRA
jgi:tRNA(Ile)-lysidine synthase